LEDVLKYGLYILLLLPGYIFAQTVEYHLLREKSHRSKNCLTSSSTVLSSG